MHSNAVHLQAICERYALEVFNKADEEDRAGLADKDTARTFFAAGVFFDILGQFGAVSKELADKKKYAKFKVRSSGVHELHHTLCYHMYV